MEKNTKAGPEGFYIAHQVLRSLRPWRVRLLAFGCVLVLLFALVGLLQRLYLHSNFLRNTDGELAELASEVAVEVPYKDRWDLAELADFRQRASVFAARWWIIADDGLLIDVTGLKPNIFKHVQLVGEMKPGFPSTVTSSIHESWRTLEKTLDGGVVVVGILSPKDVGRADALLATEINKFGTTVAEAKAVRSRQTNEDVEYAVIDAGGLLVNASGGIPLMVNLNDLPVTLKHKSATTITDGSRSYRVLAVPIVSSENPPGAIVVPKDITADLQALEDQDRFNLVVVGGCFGLLVLVAIGFVLPELLRSLKSPSVEEAIRIGESKTVEFKSTYRWDTKLGANNDQLRYEVLKAIVGFLNTDGGTLYIGIEEDSAGKGRVRGIAEDLQTERGNTDQLRRNLFDLITERIGKHVAPYVTDRLDTVDGSLCWVISVKRSPIEAFIRWKDPNERKERPRFFVRRGPSTTELEDGDLSRYIKQRFQ
jgi:hypothetical protein